MTDAGAEAEPAKGKGKVKDAKGGTGTSLLSKLVALKSKKKTAA
jgi:hypothetical protein